MEDKFFVILSILLIVPLVLALSPAIIHVDLYETGTTYNATCNTTYLSSGELTTPSGTNYAVEDITLIVASDDTDLFWTEWFVNNQSKLLAYFPFDINNTYPLDRSLNHAFDIDESANAIWTLGGASGNSINFLEAGSYLGKQGALDLSNYQDLSFSFFFKDTLGSDGHLFYLTNKGANQIATYIEGSNLILKVLNSDPYTVAADITSIKGDGNWHHVAVIIDIDGLNTIFKLYIDGELEASMAFKYHVEFASSNSDFYISHSDTKDMYSFVGGSIDEFKIYGSALNEDAIYREYELTKVHYASEHNVSDDVSVLVTPVDLTCYDAGAQYAEMISLAGFDYSLNIDYPFDNVVLQRDADDYGDVKINGTFNYLTGYTDEINVVAQDIATGETFTKNITVSSSTFEDTFNLPQGEYTLTFYINGEEQNTTIQNVGVGDVYVIAGGWNVDSSYQTVSHTVDTNYSVWDVYTWQYSTGWEDYDMEIMNETHRWAEFAYDAAWEVWPSDKNGVYENIPVMVINLVEEDQLLTDLLSTTLPRGIQRIDYLTGGNRMVRGVYFNQGEEDVLAETSFNDYYASLENTIDYFKTELNYYENNSIIVIGETLKSSSETLSPDNVRQAQQTAWRNIEGVVRGALMYDVGLLDEGYTYPTEDNQIEEQNERQCSAFLDAIFGISDIYPRNTIYPKLIQINEIDDYTLKLIYDENIMGANWVPNSPTLPCLPGYPDYPGCLNIVIETPDSRLAGEIYSTEVSIPSITGFVTLPDQEDTRTRGFLLRNLNSSIILNDTNVLTTTYDLNTLTVIFDTNISEMTNLSVCTGFTCYNGIVVRYDSNMAGGVSNGMPVEIAYDISLNNEYICEEINGFYWYPYSCTENPHVTYTVTPSYNGATIYIDAKDDALINYTLNMGTSQSALNKHYNISTYLSEYTIVVDGLNTGTRYYYSVNACDEFGQCNASGINYFTTKSHSSSTETEEESSSTSVIVGDDSENEADEDGAIYITYNDVVYKFDVTHVNDEYALLTFDSTSKRFVVDDKSYVDLDDDRKPDIEITFLSKSGDKSFKFTVKETESEVDEDIISSTNEYNGNQSVIKEAISEVINLTPEEEKEFFGDVWFWGLMGFIVVGIFSFVMMSRQKPEDNF